MDYLIYRIAGFPDQHTTAPGDYEYVDGYQLVANSSFPLGNIDWMKFDPAFSKSLMLCAFENVVVKLQEESGADIAYALIGVDEASKKTFIQWA